MVPKAFSGLGIIFCHIIRLQESQLLVVVVVVVVVGGGGNKRGRVNDVNLL